MPDKRPPATASGGPWFSPSPGRFDELKTPCETSRGKQSRPLAEFRGEPMSQSDSLSGGLPIEREYVFAECPQVPGTRDAVNVWLEEDRGAFGMRIGMEAAAPKWAAHEIWLDIAFPSGRVLSLRTEGTTHPPIGPEGKPTILGAG